MALLNQYDVERYCQVTAARADLRVSWEDETVPATNGRIINLPRITSQTTPEMAEELMAFVTHEVSHVLHTNFRTLNEHAVDPKASFLGFITNGLEDDCVDWINASEFRGDKDLISNVFGDRVEKLVPIITKKLREATTDPEKRQFIENNASFFTWYTDLRSDLINGIARHGRAVYDELTPQGKKYADKLYAGPYAEECRKLREEEGPNRTQKVYDLAKRIYEEVYEQDPEQEEQRCKDKQKSEGSGDGQGEGEGGKPSSGKSGSDGEGEESEGKGAAGRGKVQKGNGKEGEFHEADYDELSTDFQPLRKNGMGGGQHLNYEHWKPSGRVYTPTPLKDTILIDFKNKKSNHGGIPATTGISEGRGYTKYANELMHGSSEGFAQKVRMLLQIRSKGRTQYGTKQGRLHAGNLYRVTIPNAGAYSQHVFKKHITSDVLDTSVTVLCDTSGSMNGEKYAHTIVAAVKLSNTLGNTLHIPTEILGFTEHECRNTMFVHRDFSTKLLSDSDLISRMAHAGSYMSQNCDGDSVVFAYHRLLAQKTKRRVLIVLSDGSPASSKGGDITSYTKKVVEAIEADKRVDIIGVGLMDDNVKRYYKHNERINSAEEIETSLLKLIERKILV